MVTHVILAHPLKTFFARPVAAQAYLDEIVPGNVALLDEFSDRGPVGQVVADPEAYATDEASGEAGSVEYVIQAVSDAVGRLRKMGSLPLLRSED